MNRDKKKSMSLKTTLIILAIVIFTIIIVSSSMFVVNQGEYAVVKQFGKVVEIYDQPGLKFKIPFKSYWHNQTFTDQILRISHQGTLFVKLPFKHLIRFNQIIRSIINDINLMSQTLQILL